MFRVSQKLKKLSCLCRYGMSGLLYQGGLIYQGECLECGRKIKSYGIYHYGPDDEVNNKAKPIKVYKSKNAANKCANKLNEKSGTNSPFYTHPDGYVVKELKETNMNKDPVVDRCVFQPDYSKSKTFFVHDHLKTGEGTAFCPGCKEYWMFTRPNVAAIRHYCIPCDQEYHGVPQGHVCSRKVEENKVSGSDTKEVKVENSTPEAIEIKPESPTNTNDANKKPIDTLNYLFKAIEKLHPGIAHRGYGKIELVAGKEELVTISWYSKLSIQGKYPFNEFKSFDVDRFGHADWPKVLKYCLGLYDSIIEHKNNEKAQKRLFKMYREGLVKRLENSGFIVTYDEIKKAYNVSHISNKDVKFDIHFNKDKSVKVEKSFSFKSNELGDVIDFLDMFIGVENR